MKCVHRYFGAKPLAPPSSFILIGHVWNGLYRENLRGEFNVPRGTKDTVIFDDDDFAAVSEVLAFAKIKTGDFEEVLNGVKEGDFVFIDPPYTVKHNGNGFVKYNESIFSWNDQVRLAKR